MKKATCPICLRHLGDGKWIGHANYKDRAHIHIYEAWCPDCHIQLRRSIAGREDSGWTGPSEDVSRIQEYLDEEALAAVSTKLSRYPALFARWEREFVGVRRPSDKIARYVSEHDERTALAVIRGNVVITTFSTLTSL